MANLLPFVFQCQEGSDLEIAGGNVDTLGKLAPVIQIAENFLVRGTVVHKEQLGSGLACHNYALSSGAVGFPQLYLHSVFEYSRACSKRPVKTAPPARSRFNRHSRSYGGQDGGQAHRRSQPCHNLQKPVALLINKWIDQQKGCPYQGIIS